MVGVTTTELLCLDCSTTLDDSWLRLDDGYRECLSCRLWYSPELLDQADPALWERVRRERPFVRDGHQLFITIPQEWLTMTPVGDS